MSDGRHTTLPDRIAVMVVDTRVLMREGICRLLGEADEFECFGGVSEFPIPDAGAPWPQPDVVAIGLDSGRGAAFMLIDELHRSPWLYRVVLITGHARDADVRKALDLEVAGFVHESGGFKGLCQAIRAVHAGEHYYAPEILSRIDASKAEFKPDRSARTRLDLLSPRERQLLRVLALGKSLRQACEQLRISYKTADKQKVSLMKKLRIHDRVSLARFAIREGIVNL